MQAEHTRARMHARTQYNTSKAKKSISPVCYNYINKRDI